jgi:hypothetical protein
MTPVLAPFDPSQIGPIFFNLAGFSRKQSAMLSFIHTLASRRDAPAGLIQWGDDPSSTRDGLRSFHGFEAHRFSVAIGRMRRTALLAKPTLIVFIVGRSAFLVLRQVIDPFGTLGWAWPLLKKQGEEQVRRIDVGDAV